MSVHVPGTLVVNNPIIHGRSSQSGFLGGSSTFFLGLLREFVGHGKWYYNRNGWSHPRMYFFQESIMVHNFLDRQWEVAINNLVPLFLFTDIATASSQCLSTMEGLNYLSLRDFALPSHHLEISSSRTSPGLLCLMNVLASGHYVSSPALASLFSSAFIEKKPSSNMLTYLMLVSPVHL